MKLTDASTQTQRRGATSDVEIEQLELVYLADGVLLLSRCILFGILCSWLRKLTTVTKGKHYLIVL